MPRIWRSFAVLRRARSLRSLSGCGRLRMTNYPVEADFVIASQDDNLAVEGVRFFHNLSG